MGASNKLDYLDSYYNPDQSIAYIAQEIICEGGNRARVGNKKRQLYFNIILWTLILIIA